MAPCYLPLLLLLGLLRIGASLPVQSRQWPCRTYGTGVHLPRVSLPAWYSVHQSVHNWPPMSETDADPKLDTFSSQGEEDEFAYTNFFYNRGRGTYLEFGAVNGKVLSNTRWFHRALGWRGVLIEPADTAYLELTRNRPADINVHAAICAEFREVHFITAGATGGIWEFMSDAFKRKWHPNITVNTLPTVPCIPLTPLLAKFGVRHVDWMSLDVEGGELEVLRTLDFDCVSISVLCVEADGSSPTKDQGVRDLLASKGYIHYTGATINNNDWFVHQSFVASKRPSF